MLHSSLWHGYNSNRTFTKSVLSIVLQFLCYCLKYFEIFRNVSKILWILLFCFDEKRGLLQPIQYLSPYWGRRSVKVRGWRRKEKGQPVRPVLLKVKSSTSVWERRARCENTNLENFLNELHERKNAPNLILEGMSFQCCHLAQVIAVDSFVLLRRQRNGGKRREGEEVIAHTCRR